MGDTISLEALKSALVELAKSDKAFLLALMKEIATPEQATKKPKRKPKVIAQPVKPQYRPHNVELWRKQYALEPQTIDALKPLFAEEPEAEEIIKTMKK